jgi:polyisoprenoid-binding protein YceI
MPCTLFAYFLIDYKNKICSFTNMCLLLALVLSLFSASSLLAQSSLRTEKPTPLPSRVESVFAFEEKTSNSDQDLKKFSYSIDPEHTSIRFRVRHMGLSWVEGQFREFSGTFFFNPEKPLSAKTDFTIKVSSIDTGSSKRDRHIRSADFLKNEDFKQIYFISNKVEAVSDKHFKVKGVLSIKDVQKEVVLDVNYLGTLIDPWGTERAAFEGKTVINRKQFGLVWNRIIETGALLVGEEVEIYFSLQGLLLKDNAPKMTDPSTFKFPKQ